MQDHYLVYVALGSVDRSSDNYINQYLLELYYTRECSIALDCSTVQRNVMSIAGATPCHKHIHVVANKALQ